jgi:hypothetical protein
METQAINELVKKHGITIESRFIPWSLSRNAGEDTPSLNWKITLKQNGRDLLTTDYMAGCAHCPAYDQRGYNTVDGRADVLSECEKGKRIRPDSTIGLTHRDINPDSLDVIHSLLMDSEALDYSSYEEWAGEFGFDEDSRKGEETYRACLKIALSLRPVGESLLAELRDAFQDY